VFCHKDILNDSQFYKGLFMLTYKLLLYEADFRICESIYIYNG